MLLSFTNLYRLILLVIVFDYQICIANIQTISCNNEIIRPVTNGNTLILSNQKELQKQ
jgi:hypothetical protein